MPHITLTPAYSRDYKNKTQVLHDFLADKDFQDAATARYFNYTDAKILSKSGMTKLAIRYKGLRSILVLTVDCNGMVTLDGKKVTPVKPQTPLAAVEVTATLMDRARINKLATLVKTLCEAVTPALDSLRHANDDLGHNSQPGSLSHDVFLLRSSRLEKAYEAVTLARLEVL